MNTLTPRIKITVSNESTLCKGIYINHKGDSYGLNKEFDTENEALLYLHAMRDNNNAEFSIILVRE